MPALTHAGDARTHTLTVLVENRAGVLTRVAGLFARRGFNIFSLAVAPTDDDRFSRITIVVDVESAPLEQIIKQLDKLINVVKISELGPGEAVERELLLVTVKSPPETRGQVIELVDLYERRGARRRPRQHDHLPRGPSPAASTTSRSCSGPTASSTCSAPAASPCPSCRSQAAR